MKLYVDTLKKRSLSPEKQQHYYEQIAANITRLELMVTNVLEAGRFEHGEFHYNAEDRDLSRDLDVYLAHWRPFAEASGILLVEDIEPGVLARSDFDAMAAVLRNVLDNAFKYVRAEGAEIRVRLHRDGNMARIEVIDNGIGVEPKDLEMIFRKFARAGSSEVKERKGAGLGLYLVREIMSALGGSVHIDSKGAGAGATITLELPASEPEL